MCVDLADAAATALKLQFGVYRTSALADKVTRYIYWRTSGGATSDIVHWTVSAGKEHLYIDIESPRPGEINSVATVSSYIQAFFLGDVIPYHTADSIPTVVCIGNYVGASGLGTTNMLAHVGRNQANNASWVTARLASLHPPTCKSAALISAVQKSSSDSKTYIFPYLIFEEVAGLRGRVAKCFFTGFNFTTGAQQFNDQILPAMTKLTYGGETYILLAPMKAVQSTSYAMPWGTGPTSGVVPTNSPVIAIPFS
jgi:hypothetical protein